MSKELEDKPHSVDPFFVGYDHAGVSQVVIFEELLYIKINYLIVLNKD